jgi:aminoglycoside phosphotransferase (APT) family kinase protein
LLDQQASELATIFGKLAANVTAFIEAVLPLWANTLPTPVHGDLKLENGVDSFGAVILLDWEMFGLGDPALEVASFFQMSQHELDATAQAEWLDNYLSIFDQAGLAQRIASYQRILPFQAACFLLDGLRQHLDQSSTSDEAEVAENLPFLLTTLQVTLAQAADALQLDVPNLEDAVQTLLSFRQRR